MRLLIATLLCSLRVLASCSGSGTTWTCTAGTTPSQVNTTISSASDGATLTFDAGSYSWGGSSIDFPLTKAIALICATEGDCDVSASNTVLTTPTGTSSKAYRFSGFDVTMSGGQFFWSCPAGGCSATLISSLRIDHNIFRTSVADHTFFLFGENTSVDNYYYGSIDHNTFLCTSSCLAANMVNGSSDNATTGALASGNNLFFEDNVATVTTITNTGTGFVDGWGGHGVVVRNNTLTNMRILQHGVTHAWGPRNFEVYRNAGTFNSGGSGSGIDDCYRFVHHQGSGTFMVWGNTCTPRSGAGHADMIDLLHYRSTRNAIENRCDGTVSGVDGNRSPTGTYYGYPCKRQPGRDVDATAKPVYAWANQYGDDNAIAALNCSEADTGVGNPVTCTHHIAANRDRFDAVSITPQTSATSPFDGTIGMGFGTLANRPTTCTTGTEAADSGLVGVGYFATDDGAQGTLYRCSATNTWTAHYTPYTYPHPLQGAASSSPSKSGGGARHGGGAKIGDE